MNPFVRLTSILCCAFLAAGLCGCSDEKDCKPTEIQLCLEGSTYLINTCGEPEVFVERCECGCLDGLSCKKCGDGPTCQADSCSGHGDCDDSGTRLVCTCDTGYQGSTCDACAPGYYDPGNGSCQPAPDCILGGCPGRQVCDESGQEPVCVCFDGYTGADCDSCDGGFQDNDGDGLCAPSCAASGIDCGEHGTCVDDDGVARCRCDDGYQGARCDDCGAGYFPDPQDGSLCVEDAICFWRSCSSRGECDDDSGSVVCDCREGYDGDHCERCADGFREIPGSMPRCEPASCESAALECGEHGSCEDAMGLAVCVCETGYFGPGCAYCYFGYHDEGGTCVPDETCTDMTCGSFGTCDDSDGTPACTCDQGVTGDHCDRGTVLAGYIIVDTGRFRGEMEGEILESYSFRASFVEMNGTLPTRQVGPCSILEMDVEGGEAVDRLYSTHAGNLVMTGGSDTIMAFPIPNNEGPGFEYPSIYGSLSLWEGGETLAFTAAGDDDGVPGFAAALTAPHMVQPLAVDGNPWPDRNGQIELDAGSEHTFTWSGGVTGLVKIEFFSDDIYPTIVTCLFDAAAGSANLSAEVSAELESLGASRVSLTSLEEQTVQAGDYEILIQAEAEHEDNHREVVLQ